MQIKEMVLPSEKQQIIDFLASFDLTYEEKVDFTIYLEDDDKIIGTVSAFGYIIKCLAVSDGYQGENLAGKLVGEVINRLAQQGIYHYQVFTKTKYRTVFESLGFTLLSLSEKTAVLEGGSGKIEDELAKIKTQMHFNLGIDFTKDNDIGAIVLNGNPFTNGHLALCEYAMKNHDYLLVFVLEEEGSEYSFKERFAFAYTALRPYSHQVMVVPSTKYVVSRSTFPGYFLKSVDETTEEYATFDAQIFRDKFMPALQIKKRYIGSEVTDYMSIYNVTLKKVLGDKVEEIARVQDGGEPISAKRVRKLVSEGNYAEACKYIPTACLGLFLASSRSKNV